MKYIYIVVVVLISFISSYAQNNPKREFRGAWLHVIGQSQYQNKSTEECKKYISLQMDKLLESGCNVVIFQVRPTADALYESEIEPWSSWLTGKRGRKPNPYWDPLLYAIDEAHKRGMELHAWLNPYRVTSSAKEVLPSSHLVNTQPHRFIKFNGQTFFDPAYPENRQYIAEIIRDIVSRYDIDAIHLDDYFYPYPNGNKRFKNDDESYAKFGDGMERNDWRRQNVDLLIELLHHTIKETKPWVRFGISPFGIWRNKKNDPRGSESSGLQNFDDLYADVLLWDENKWIDYLAPQLYWQLDLEAAPSRKLIKWWNDNVKNAHLYIGQEVKRTMDTPDPGNNDVNELDTKVLMSRQLCNIDGNIWWHGYWVTENYKGVADSLALKYQSTLAVPPAYGTDRKAPAVNNLRREHIDGETFICWNHSEDFNGYGADCNVLNPVETDIVKYIVYQFFRGEEIDLEDSQTIIAITPFNRIRIDDTESDMIFIVTPVDRLNREGNPARIEL